MSDRPTILVVDDDLAVCDLVTDVLEDAGYRVECVTTGAAGLSRIRDGEIDLVLLDMMLPDAHGRDIISAIQSFDRPSVRLIVFTGSPRARDQLCQDGVEVEGYIAKPFDLDALLAAVHSVLGTATK